MADVKTEQEPSIEEILESIRQIISEDTEEEAAAADAETTLEAPKTEDVPASDLSLTPEPEKAVPETVLEAPAQDEPPAQQAGEPLSLTPDIAEPVKNGAAPLDLTERAETDQSSSSAIEMMDMPMTENDKEAAQDHPAEITMGDSKEIENKATDALMSPETANAVTDSLAKLLSSNVAIESGGHDGKVTLEEIARSLMKPLIKVWLDKNLPAIIEKIVRNEVEKLSRRAMDR